MTTPELPTLDLHCESGRAHAAYTPESVEARERILLARIAELSSAAQEVIDNLPHRHDVNLDRLRAAIGASRGAK